jgi:phage tail sheath gpL-like
MRIDLLAPVPEPAAAAGGAAAETVTMAGSVEVTCFVQLRTTGAALPAAIAEATAKTVIDRLAIMIDEAGDDEGCVQGWFDV